VRAGNILFADHGRKYWLGGTYKAISLVIIELRIGFYVLF
jgi:hypothetical protein